VIFAAAAPFLSKISKIISKERREIFQANFNTRVGHKKNYVRRDPP